MVFESGSNMLDGAESAHRTRRISGVCEIFFSPMQEAVILPRWIGVK